MSLARGMTGRLIGFAGAMLNVYVCGQPLTVSYNVTPDGVCVVLDVGKVQVLDAVEYVMI